MKIIFLFILSIGIIFASCSTNDQATEEDDFLRELDTEIVKMDKELEDGFIQPEEVKVLEETSSESAFDRLQRYKQENIEKGLVKDPNEEVGLQFEEDSKAQERFFPAER